MTKGLLTLSLRRRTPLLLLAAAILISMGGKPLQVHAKTAFVKATWLWDTVRIRTSSPDILDFSRSNGVNVIYLQVNRDVKMSAYADFIREAGKRGIAVHALDGRASWGYEINRPGIDRTFDWLARYQKQAAADERFAGIHMDIEPYTLPSWSREGSDLIAQWQSNVQYMVSRAEALELPIAADIPFWLGNYRTPDGSETLSRWMMRQYGAVTVLAYRDSAQRIANAAAPVLSEAAELDIPVTVGVETLPSSEGDSITFHEEGRAKMIEQLALASAQLRKYGSYRGIAIHDYESWSEMGD